MTWVAVLLAMAGLGVLTLGDVSAGLGLGYGEALTLVSALIYALHIVGLGAWSNARDAAGHVDRPVHRDRRDLLGRRRARTGSCSRTEPADWLSIFYMALFAGAAALLGQTWAQAHLPPTRTAIIMSMEPVFAAFFAVLAGRRVRRRRGCCWAARSCSRRC